jgi:hypothetical protein
MLIVPSLRYTPFAFAQSVSPTFFSPNAFM